MPAEIGDLAALEFLSIALNQIAALPPQIGNLRALTTLLASNMPSLTAMPPEIGNLGALVELNVSGCQLTALPRELGRLTQLEQLLVNDNPLVTPPPDVVAQGTQAILQFLRQQPE